MNFNLDTVTDKYDCVVTICKNNKINNPLLTKNNNQFNLEIGLDNKQQIMVSNLKQILQNIVNITNNYKINSIIIPILTVENKTENWFLAFTTQSIIDLNYQIKKIGKNDDKNTLNLVAFIKTGSNNKSIIKGIAVGNGINFAKKLADLPSNICTPSYLADSAKELADKFNLSCEVLDKKQMHDLGMNSLLSVAKGSIEEPKLITLKYNKGGNNKPFILVGKGVTFDSGGISLKPGNAMDEMKYDMCGAAAALGVMHVIASLSLKINLIIIIPSVENMPAHNASKPGDIITSMSGQTIEILNTDAEGRLILCDALTYAEKFNPQTVIDMATLTGSVIVALGHDYSGLIANNNDLARELITSSKIADDNIWQLPIDENFDKLLASNFADMANISDGRAAGTITAGCFLARFTKNYHWAHLDIAGTAWHSGKNKGATGRPVALLSEFLINQ